MFTADYSVFCVKVKGRGGGAGQVAPGNRGPNTLSSGYPETFRSDVPREPFTVPGDICGYNGKATDIERMEARLVLNTTWCPGQPPTDNPTPSFSNADGERPALMVGWGEL